MWSVYLEVTKYKKCLSFWSQDPYNLYVVVVVVGSIQKFCLKIAKIENCQNWKLLGLNFVKFQVAKIASCQNWKLPKLQVAKVESDFIILLVFLMN